MPIRSDSGTAGPPVVIKKKKKKPVPDSPSAYIPMTTNGVPKPGQGPDLGPGYVWQEQPADPTLLPEAQTGVSGWSKAAPLGVDEDVHKYQLVQNQNKRLSNALEAYYAVFHTYPNATFLAPVLQDGEKKDEVPDTKTYKAVFDYMKNSGHDVGWTMIQDADTVAKLDEMRPHPEAGTINEVGTGGTHANLLGFAPDTETTRERTPLEVNALPTYLARVDAQIKKELGADSKWTIADADFNHDLKKRLLQQAPADLTKDMKLDGEWRMEDQRALDNVVLRRAFVLGTIGKKGSLRDESNVFLTTQGFGNSSVENRRLLTELGMKPGMDPQTMMWDLWRASDLTGKTENAQAHEFYHAVDKLWVSKALQEKVDADNKSALLGQVGAALSGAKKGLERNRVLGPVAAAVGGLNEALHLGTTGRLAIQGMFGFQAGQAADTGVPQFVGKAAMIPLTTTLSVGNQKVSKLLVVSKNVTKAKSAAEAVKMAGAGVIAGNPFVPQPNEVVTLDASLRGGEYLAVVGSLPAAANRLDAYAGLDGYTNKDMLEGGRRTTEFFGGDPNDMPGWNLFNQGVIDIALQPGADEFYALPVKAAGWSARTYELGRVLGKVDPVLDDAKTVLARTQSPSVILRAYPDMDIDFAKQLAKVSDPGEVKRLMLDNPHMMGGKYHPNDILPLKTMTITNAQKPGANSALDRLMTHMFADQAVKPDAASMVDWAQNHGVSFKWRRSKINQWSDYILDGADDEERRFRAAVFQRATEAWYKGKPAKGAWARRELASRTAEAQQRSEAIFDEAKANELVDLMKQQSVLEDRIATASEEHGAAVSDVRQWREGIGVIQHKLNGEYAKMRELGRRVAPTQEEVDEILTRSAAKAKALEKARANEASLSGQARNLAEKRRAEAEVRLRERGMLPGSEPATAPAPAVIGKKKPPVEPVAPEVKAVVDSLEKQEGMFGLGEAPVEIAPGETKGQLFTPETVKKPPAEKVENPPEQMPGQIGMEVPGENMPAAAPAAKLPVKPIHDDALDVEDVKRIRDALGSAGTPEAQKLIDLHSEARQEADTLRGIAAEASGPAAGDRAGNVGRMQTDADLYDHIKSIGIKMDDDSTRTFWDAHLSDKENRLAFRGLHSNKRQKYPMGMDTLAQEISLSYPHYGVTDAKSLWEWMQRYDPKAPVVTGSRPGRVIDYKKAAQDLAALKKPTQEALDKIVEEAGLPVPYQWDVFETPPLQQQLADRIKQVEEAGREHELRTSPSALSARMKQVEARQQLLEDIGAYYGIDLVGGTGATGNVAQAEVAYNGVLQELIDVQKRIESGGPSPVEFGGVQFNINKLEEELRTSQASHGEAAGKLAELAPDEADASSLEGLQSRIEELSGLKNAAEGAGKVVEPSRWDHYQAFGKLLASYGRKPRGRRDTAFDVLRVKALSVKGLEKGVDLDLSDPKEVGTFLEHFKEPIDDLTSRMAAGEAMSPKQHADAVEMGNVLAELIESASPDVLAKAAPNWVWQDAYYFYPSVNNAMGLRYNGGSLARGWEIKNRFRVRKWAWMPSQDDVTNIYKNFLLAKFSTMLRIPFGDEFWRIPLGGMMPFRVDKRGTLMHWNDQLPKDLQDAYGDMDLPTEIVEGYVNLFDRVEGRHFHAIGPEDRRRYHSAVNYTWATRSAQDPATRPWVAGYERAKAEMPDKPEEVWIAEAEKDLRAACDTPAEEGGIKEFIDDVVVKDAKNPAASKRAWVKRQTMTYTRVGGFTRDERLWGLLKGRHLTKSELDDLVTNHPEWMPPAVVRKARMASAPTPLHEWLYNIPDAVGENLKRVTFTQRYTGELRYLDELRQAGVKMDPEWMKATASARAQRYVIRNQYSSSKLLIEDLLRNDLLFLPAWRQFAVWWGKEVLQHPAGLGMGVVKAKTTIPNSVAIGNTGFTANPQSALFILGGPSAPMFGADQQSNLQKTWGVATDYLPSTGIANMAVQAVQEEFPGSLDFMAGKYPFSFSRPGSVLNTALDRMLASAGYFGESIGLKTGFLHKIPLVNRPQYVYDTLLINAIRKQWATTGKMDVNGARRSVAEGLAADGLWKFFSPFSGGWRDSYTGNVQTNLNNYETAMTAGDSAAAAKSLKDPLVADIVAFRNLPDEERDDFLLAHQAIIPWVISSHVSDNTAVYSIIYSEWQKNAQRGATASMNPEAYINSISNPEYRAQGLSAGGVVEELDYKQARLAQDKLIAAREKGFVTLLAKTRKEHPGWAADALAPGSWTYEYLRAQFERGEGPFKNSGMVLREGGDLSSDQLKALGASVDDNGDLKGPWELKKSYASGPSLTSGAMKTAALIESSLGESYMQGAFANYPSVIRQRQADKLTATAHLLTVAKTASPTMLPEDWKAIGVKPTPGLETAQSAMQNIVNSFYGGLVKDHVTMMSDEYKARRAKMAADLRSVAQKHGAGILVAGLPEKLKFLTESNPELIDGLQGEVHQTSGSYAGRKSDAARKGKGSIKTVQAQLFMAKFIKEAQAKMVHGNQTVDQWHKRAAKELSPLEMTVWKDYWRSFSWQYVLKESKGARETLRTSYNKWMKAPGFSPASTAGKEWRGYVESIVDDLKTLSPEFKAEYDALDPYGGLSADLIDYTQ